MRIPVDDFVIYRDLFKDMTEILSRQIVIFARINNIQKRGDHNQFFSV